MRLPQGFLWVYSSETPPSIGDDTRGAYIKSGSEIHRLTPPAVVPPAPVPQGGIIMWSGLITNIPVGWALCDGSAGTPDLRDRFIVGARTDSGGAARTNITGSLTVTGGSKDATLVGHRHNFVADDNLGGLAGTNIAGYGSNRLQRISGGGSEGGGDLHHFETSLPRRVDSNGNIITSAGISGTNEGDGTNANLPPYYALAFIMKISST
jgi:hypothetical protein